MLNGSLLALRSLEGGVLDFTENYVAESHPNTDVAVNLQALNFINCEMYYEEHDLENLEKALAGIVVHPNPRFPVSQTELATFLDFLVLQPDVLMPWASRSPASRLLCWFVLNGLVVLERVFDVFTIDRFLGLICFSLGASLSNRKEFFMECLRLRRHERNLWDDTPLAKIFTPREEWHMIRARAMVQQIGIAITKAIRNRKKPSPWWNPYDIMKR